MQAEHAKRSAGVSARYLRIAAWRRLTQSPLSMRLVGLVVGLAALAAGWLAFDALAATDLAPAELAARDHLVRGRAFWINTLVAFIFAYVSFEVLMRARDRRFVGTLPISGSSRYTTLLVRALVRHTPLLLPSALYALALALRGAPRLATYVAALGALLFLVGIPLCCAVHLWAGHSLLGDATPLKRMMASGLVADEAALLVWAPAGGLLAVLVLGLFAEFTLRDALIYNRADGALIVVGVAAVVTLLCVRSGRRLANESMHLIQPRFDELDVPPPFTDDGVRRRVPGEWLARYAPAPATPYVLRDLRQLRRRYRLDRWLLGVFAIVALRLNLAGDSAASLSHNLTALALFVGLFLLSAFRLYGRELDSFWLSATIVDDRRPAALGRVLADATLPLFAPVVAAVAVAIAGDLATALWTLVGGLLVVATMLVCGHSLAAWAFPGRVGAAAIIWRAGVLALSGVVLWQIT